MERSGQPVFLEAKGIHKSYPMGKVSVQVLKGIDIAVQKGEWVAILGASGSGKTTLLSILGVLERPDNGGVSLEGRSYSSMGRATAAAFRVSKIGFIFQFYHMLPELTVLENVMLPGLIYGRSSSSLRKEGAELLVRVGLGERLEHRPSELSGGEQQRAAIARSFINSPALILADEPTGNLDSETGKGILEIFKDLHDFKRTLIMVTHDPAVARCAGRIVHVRDGIIDEKIGV